MEVMIKKIYFDLDGVLADFDYAIYMFGGFKNGECHDSEVKKTMKNTKHFFYKVPPNNLMIKCFHYFHKKEGDKCQILSALPDKTIKVYNAKKDKIAWVKKYLGCDVKVNLCYRREKKKFCKGIGYILIDDYKKNINEWLDAGGTGVLYRKSMDNEIEELLQMLE